MRFITPFEIARLASTISPRYAAMVVFDAYCGLRLSELAGLRRTNLDVTARTVRVVDNAVEVRGEIVWGTPKTRAGRRTIAIPTRVTDVLADYLGAYVDLAQDALVFPGAAGGVLRAGQWRARHWYPAVDRADVAA
jgi:integrase